LGDLPALVRVIVVTTRTGPEYWIRNCKKNSTNPKFATQKKKMLALWMELNYDSPTGKLDEESLNTNLKKLLAKVKNGGYDVLLGAFFRAKACT
jgi:hypothetical protein